MTAKIRGSTYTHAHPADCTIPPAMIGPTATTAIDTPNTVPIAFPRSSMENTSINNAVEAGMSRAALIPSTARHK